MTIEEFKAQTLELVLKYMVSIYHLIQNKKVSAETKQKLIATALSLLIYAQEELELLGNNSTESISPREANVNTKDGEKF
ncbi:MAG: hypothetical protein ACI4J1_02285 [Ruminiclostridium sp.]